MPAAPLPANEEERLAALRGYEILDTACERAFDDLAGLAARVSGAPVALVSLLDRDRQWFKARHGLDIAETPRDLAFCGHAILTPEVPLIVPDARRDPRFADNPLVLGQPGIRFYAGVPLVNPEGHALGTLCVLDHRPRDLDAGTVEALQGLARAVGTTLELHRAMRRARELAMQDPLTGLPNRRALIEGLRRALARQRRTREVFSLLYIDLDGFKAVNDASGHAAGDAVLRLAAAALRGSVREEDLAARLGGDEFAVLLVGGDGSEASVAAERVRLALHTCLASHGVAVRASVGAVCFLGAPADEAEALGLADAQMYRAKTAGGDRVATLDYRPPRALAA